MRKTSASIRGALGLVPGDNLDLDRVPLRAAERALGARLVRVVDPAVDAVQVEGVVAAAKGAAQPVVVVRPRVALIVNTRRPQLVPADGAHLDALPLPEAHGVPLGDLERGGRRLLLRLTLALRHAPARASKRRRVVLPRHVRVIMLN